LGVGVQVSPSAIANSFIYKELQKEKSVMIAS
jgi:hypothetical protein